jgi:hypothetical protein
MISPGSRQKHRKQIVKKIRAIREWLDRIEKAAEQFEEDESVINAGLVSSLGEDSTALLYLIGQANGALVLADAVFDEKTVREAIEGFDCSDMTQTEGAISNLWKFKSEKGKERKATADG